MPGLVLIVFLERGVIFFWKHMEAICGLYPWIKNQRMRLCSDASFGKNAMDRKPFLSMPFLSENCVFFSSLFCCA